LIKNLFMELEIRKFKDPILKERCEEVKEITPEIKELIFDMEKIMIEKQGVGLAAPQVGKSKRIIVVQPNLETPKTLALINPKIITESAETNVIEEGCLSFPGIFLEIERAKEIEIEALDINGQKITMKTKSLLARVIQHEIDHLDGVLFFQKLGIWKRLKFKLKYNL